MIITGAYNTVHSIRIDSTIPVSFHSLMIFTNDQNTIDWVLILDPAFQAQISNKSTPNNLTSTNETVLCYNSIYNIYNTSEIDCSFPPPPPALNFSTKNH